MCCIIALRYKTDSITTPITPIISDVTGMGRPGGMIRYKVTGNPSQRPCKKETKT